MKLFVEDPLNLLIKLQIDFISGLLIKNPIQLFLLVKKYKSHQRFFR